MLGPGRPAAPPPQQQRPTYPPLRQRRRGRPARPPPRPRARRASAASTRSPGAPPRPPEVLDISSVLVGSHSTSWSPGHPGGPSCSLARMASTRARGPPSQSSSSFGPPRACLPSFRGRRAPGACCRRRPSRDGVCLSSRFFIRNSILLGSNKVKVVFFRRTLIEALVEALELAASVDRRRKGLAHLLLSLRSSSKVTNTGPHGRTAQFSDTTMPWLRLRGTSRSFTHTESNRPLPALSRERDREREREGAAK